MVVVTQGIVAGCAFAKTLVQALLSRTAVRITATCTRVPFRACIEDCNERERKCRKQEWSQKLQESCINA